MSGQGSGFGIQGSGGRILRNYRDLKVWQKSRALVKEVYLVTKKFPGEEKYRLTDQLCRAVVSVSSNIAEGNGRKSTKEYIRFLRIAYGSLMECETQLILAHDLGYITASSLDELFEVTGEVGKMLNGLLNALQDKLQTVQNLNPESRIPNPESTGGAYGN
jgi:four helix bundle protein